MERLATTMTTLKKAPTCRLSFLLLLLLTTSTVVLSQTTYPLVPDLSTLNDLSKFWTTGDLVQGAPDDTTPANKPPFVYPDLTPFWPWPTLGVGNLTTIHYPCGILLPYNSLEISDAALMTPIIQIAIDDAFRIFNMRFLVTNVVSYDLAASGGKCDPIKVFSAAKGSVGLIVPVLSGSGTQLTPALKTVGTDQSKNLKVMLGRMVIGPACAASLTAAAMMGISTTKPLIMLTGQAELAYSIRDIGLTIRTSYSVYNVWYLFKAMSRNYNWTIFTSLYDKYDTDTPYGTLPFSYYDAYRLMIQGGFVAGFLDPGSNGTKDNNRPPMANSVLKDAQCDLSNPFDATTSKRPDPADTILDTCLNNAKSNARIIALMMQPKYVRQTLLKAASKNMTNSEYVYLVTDVFHDLYINPAAGTPAWQGNDGNDDTAKQAFRTLYVIALEEYATRPAYVALQTKLTAKQPSMNLNYYYAAFYDSIMMYAQGLRGLYDNPAGNTEAKSDHDTVDQLSKYGCSDLDATGLAVQTPCNRLFSKVISLSSINGPLDGASGRVTLDDLADRLSYLTLYAMTDVDNGKFMPVATYDPVNDVFAEISVGSIPWLGGSPPKSTPDCGFDGTEGPCALPFPTVAVACGITIPVVCGLVALGVYWYHLAKKRAITDREWIVHSRSLNYQRHKRNEFGDDNPENFMEESAAYDAQKDMEGGHSMGRSMGASMGQSMGASLNMTGSMRKKLMLMGEHFGQWNRQAYVIRWTNRRKVALTPQLTREVRVVRKLTHENIAKFVGACLDLDHVCVLYELCNKGPLNLQFEGDARAKLDWAIRMSWIKDIVNGMGYLHETPVGPHTRFTSHCCFIDARFVVKITDYGLSTLYTPTLSEFWTFKRNPTNSTSLLWTSPEVLRADAEGTLGTLVTRESDVYSFGIVLQEIILRAKPYCMYEQSSNAIVDEIRRGTLIKGIHYRPFFPPSVDCPAGLIDLATQCWAEDPNSRPLFDKIKVMLRGITKDLNMGEHTNIMDVFMQQMEETSHQLQVTVQQKDGELIKQELRSDEAYLYIFPKQIAESVMNYDDVEPKRFEHATILVTDIVGFETICSLSKPADITQLLEEYYDVLESLYAKFTCFKIEHTADSVLVAAGISGESGRHGAREIARLALFLLVEIRHFKIHHRPNEQLKMRIAVASGPLVLSVLQLHAPRYGICGELIQIVHRLLFTSECLRIHATTSTKKLLESYKVFRFKKSALSPVPITDDVDVETFWLVDEEGNDELKSRRQTLMDGFEVAEEEL